MEHARKEAGRLDFKHVYLITGEIGYYEKYGCVFTEGWI
jgi:hypothetical protein